MAVFFLLAAFLKWQAFVSGVPSAVSEVAPQLEWGLIQFEFLLAIWLLSGWATSALWWVLVALFSIFTGAGLYQVWMGQSSCGCFGQYSLHPLWVVSFDVVILVLLFWSGSIRLIGAANDCQCSAGQDLPVQVPAGGETVVRVRVKVGDSVGRRDGKIGIRTDHAAQPLLLCRWRGVVED